MSFDRFRTRALNLATMPGNVGVSYRGPGRNVYNRPKGFNPDLALNEAGSANEQIAEARGGRRGAGAGTRRAAVQPSVRAGIESTGLAGADIDDTMRLSQIARGEAPEQLEGQQRRMQRQQLRDIEERRNRNRASFEVSGKFRRGIIDGTFKNEAKEGQPPMYRIPDTMQGALTSLMSGFRPQLDENGKVIPVYARLGTTQGGNPAYEFFQGDQPMINNGVPAKLPLNAMNAQADIWDFQMSEQAGFGPTRRKAQQEELDIDKTRAEAIRDLAEADYARRNKPKAGGTGMTEKDIQKALLDTQKLYADLMEAELQYIAAGMEPPPEHTALKTQLEQRMNRLGRGTGQAVLISPPGQLQPTTITSKAQYDQLPSGTRFMAPDGTIRTKP